MPFEFRPAKREQVGLLLGLAGPTSSGKTYSAMRLASGIVGPGKSFAVIDTEAGRAKHYADDFRFSHCDLMPPFRPGRYLEAIKDAEAAGFAAIVIDSMSHEHAGEGGVVDWQEEELQRMAGDNYGRREAMKMAAWIKPKMERKRLVSRLLQCRAHVIFCFRAEEKMAMVKEIKDGKERSVPVSIGYQPICAKGFMFEMTASFLLTPDRQGVPQPIKLEGQHRAIFPDGQEITEQSGAALAAWASGGEAPAPAPAASYFLQGASGPPKRFPTPDAWQAEAMRWLNGMPAGKVADFQALNDLHMQNTGGEHERAVRAVIDRILLNSSHGNSNAA